MRSLPPDRAYRERRCHQWFDRPSVRVAPPSGTASCGRTDPVLTPTPSSARWNRTTCVGLYCVKESRCRGLEDSRNRRRVQQQRDRIERLVEPTNATADKSSSSAIESNDLSRSQGVEDLRNRTTCRANKCHRRRVQQQRDRIKRLAERLVETTGPVALLRLGRLGLGRLVAASSKRRTTVHLQNAPKVSFRNEPKEDLE